jgi:iron complex outermembrane receptor protein
MFSIFVFFSCPYAYSKQPADIDTLKNDTSKVLSFDLDEVVVTSFRYNKNIRNISAPFQIISKNRIEKTDIGDVSAVLNSVPGVQMQAGTFQTAKITIRGIGSRSPYSTNRTRAYIDDIPLTAGDGTTVVDDIELSFIDKIEITKGPQSAWHGSGMGGSLRFVSLLETNKPFVAETKISLGSFGLEKYSGNVRLSNTGGYLNAGIARISGDGYRQNNHFSRNSVFISGQNQKRNKLNYLFIYSGVKSQTPSSIDLETFINSPSSASANWLNVKGHKNYDRLLGGVKLYSPVGELFKNNIVLSGSIYDQYELRPFNILDDKAMAFNFQENIMFSHSLFTVSMGFEWLYENYFWRILENNTYVEQQKSNEVRNQLNSFLSFETKLHPSLILSASGNLNSTRYAVADLFPADEIDYSGNYFNKLIFSPKIGLNYRFNSDLNYYTSVGRGFSNPTVEESLNSDGYLNAALKPEHGWVMDVGARAVALDNSLSIEASVYYIMLNDLLVTKRLAESVFHGENAGSSTLKGVELQLKYNPNSYFQTLVSVNKSDNRFKEFTTNSVDLKNNMLPGIPGANANIDLQAFVYKGLQLNVIYTYAGAQFVNDDNSIKTNGWQTVNFRTVYNVEIFQKYQLQMVATINNIFDERYASMILINAPSFNGNPPRFYYPAMPRNYLFSLKMMLN